MSKGYYFASSSAGRLLNNCKSHSRQLLQDPAKSLSCQYFDFSCRPPLWSGRIINGSTPGDYGVPVNGKNILWIVNANCGERSLFCRQKGFVRLYCFIYGEINWNVNPGGWNIIFGLKLWGRQFHTPYGSSRAVPLCLLRVRALPTVRLGRSMEFNYTFEEAAIKEPALSCRLECLGYNYDPTWTL